jgi:hypothetical protein
MVAEGAPFRGVLFAGLMIKDGRVRPADEERNGPQAAASCGNMQPGSHRCCPVLKTARPKRRRSQ